ncbi:hypothetical protein DH2020_026094 [Rehmannia glutinosa]|uniref:Myb/SANT-like DNA-binding domain-containing protein n=1 Tax=Rehmannia glutinosa TaxID=99300 RepID=A0ABR0W0L9_REHGL
MVSYAHHDAGDYNPVRPVHHPSASKSKNQTLTLSDDDEPAENSTADDGKRKMSPWQRMKWTDNMVRLLIMVVFYIGDEVCSEANDSSSKKKGGGGVLQKKGKWKSVSRAMMERGFYVSPQQCEDKFNDLNKRYKRVNDILGKGISCRVVENQSLLDSMDHLSVKMKEEAAAAAVPAGLSHSSVCLHTENVPNLNRGENEGTKVGKGEDYDDDDDDDDDINDDDDNEDEEDDEDEVSDERSSRKRLKKGTTLNSPLIQQLDVELLNMLQDRTKSPVEKRQWMKTKLIRLEEERVGIQSQSFEIEKQRLKWLKFSSKKKREMEREKLTNERMKLENERMVLLIRQKELDLLDYYHHHHQQQQQQQSTNRKSDPSSITG